MATTQEQSEAEAMLQGQALIWQHIYRFVDSMALKSAVELHIADIINSHGGPITLSQIISSLDCPSPDISCLARIMRLLVCRKIFSAYPQSDGRDTLYGLTHASKWLLQDTADNDQLSLGPILLLENNEGYMAPWHCLSNCVKEGGIAFKKIHGYELFELTSERPEFNKLFNDGMACTARITTRAVIAGYKDGFGCIGSLVDVGGGIGEAAAEIVKAYPHIKAIAFDLPHVVASAPVRDGVSYVGGNMFEDIPKADAVFMKWILHDWNDEDCIKILKNCRKAIPEKTGKVIIADVVLKPEGNGLFDDTGLVLDLVMIAHSTGGKERTELEWKKVLEEGGFPRYKIIKIPDLLSIIEAYPA